MSDPRQGLLFDAETDAGAAEAAADRRAGGGPEPVPDQRAAIDDRERDLFLAAGAGTGKTEVLVTRFCDIVCAEEGDESDVGVENVLAFTFTERAAGELTRRIRLVLAQRATAETDPARARRLRGLARDSESAWISTIHAFCRRVLAAHPFAAGLDPEFAVLDETQAARLGSEAFDAAFHRFGERRGDDRFEMAAAFRLDGLREIVRAAHDELRARGQVRPVLPELERTDPDEAVAALRAAASDALDALRDAGDTRPVQTCRERLAAALAGTEAGPPEEADVDGWKETSKAGVLELEEVRRYREAHSLLARRVVEARFAHHYDYLRELVELYGEELQRLKDERGALDYEDLQLRARDMLSARPDIGARYRSQFRHVMEDEFQDTNALQLAIVRLVHDGGSGAGRLFTVGDELQSIYGFRHADVEVFRSVRAEMEEAPAATAGVRRLAGNFRSEPPVLALVNHLGRALFPGDYEELEMDAEPDEAPPAEVLVVERDGWDEESLNGLSPDEHAQPWRVAEATFLARRLAELHRDGVPRGEMVVLLRSFSYVEAYESAIEAAGLAPHVVGGRGYWSKQQVSDVRNLLACVANPRDDKALFGALASPACGASSDALWLLRQAASGRSVWGALLRLWGPDAESHAADIPSDTPADEREATRLAHEEEAREHVPDADSEALREFTARMLALRDDAPRLSLEALIDQTIGAFDYDLSLLMRTRGRRRMANVRKLMRLAREFESAEGRDLRAFLDFVDSEVETGSREAEAAVEAEGHDGVRIMTVHAAKGLEFPTVAVADLGRRLTMGFPPALRLEAAPPRRASEPDGEGQAPRVGLRLARLGRPGRQIFDFAELQTEADERERREERRILHVAMTRAERRLILSGAFELGKLDDAPKDQDPLIATVLRALGQRSDATLELEPPAPRAGFDARPGPTRVDVRVCSPADGTLADSVAGAPAAERPGALRSVPLPDQDLRPPQLVPGPPVRHISYSALSLYERCGYRFFVERVLGLSPRLPRGCGDRASGADEAADLSGRDAGDEWHLAAEGDDDLSTRYARGRVVHALLERSARASFAPPSAEHAAELLRGQGLEGRSQGERASALVEGFLASPLRRELEAAGSLHPEAPFAFRAGELVVRGEIDVLAHLGEEVLVVDYKSDSLAGASPAEHMDRYEAQRRIYALAALRRYGLPVRVAYAFLEQPGEPVEQRYQPDDVQRLADELATACAGIASWRFEVTDSPERPLCLDCPAREHLCSHERSMTLREPPSA